MKKRPSHRALFLSLSHTSLVVLSSLSFSVSVVVFFILFCLVEWGGVCFEKLKRAGTHSIGQKMS
jgi:hypothetical protein